MRHIIVRVTLLAHMGVVPYVDHIAIYAPEYHL